MADYKAPEKRKLSMMQKMGLGLAAFGEGMTGRPFASNVIGSWAKEDADSAEQAFKQWQLEQQQSPEYIMNQLAAVAAATGNKELTDQIINYQAQRQNNVSPQLISDPTANTQPPVFPTSFGREVIPPNIAPGRDFGLKGISFGKNGIQTTFGDTGSNKAIQDIYKTQLEQELKDYKATEKSLSGTGRFLQQFGRSYNELKKKYPEIGDVGFSGWATRKGAKMDNFLDGLPETKAFQVELKPLANQMARDIEGGRITDQDRQIYADAFANTLQHPTQTNIRLVSNNLVKLADKGGDISKLVGELYSSDIDIMQDIARAVMEDMPNQKQNILYQVYQMNPDRFEVVSGK